MRGQLCAVSPGVGSPLQGAEVRKEVASGPPVLPERESGRGQEHVAPRSALSHSLFSREELGGMFLGLMPNLDPKGNMGTAAWQ